MLVYKQSLIKQINSNKQVDEAILSQFILPDLIKQLSFVTQDATVIKQCIEEHCSIVKQQRKVIIRPKPGFIKDQAAEMVGLAKRLKQIKKDQLVFNRAVEEADTRFAALCQENERQVVELILKGLESNNPVQLMKRLQSQLVILCRWTRVYPHLLQLVRRDESYSNFASLLLNVTRLCSSEEKNIPQLQSVLSQVLCALVGYNSFTSEDEFALRFNIKVQLINQIAQTLRTKSDFASILVLKTLCLYNNIYEFNRVLSSPRSYYDTIEYVVLQTDILHSLSARVDEIKQSGGNLELSCIFDTVRQICQYANSLKTESEFHDDQTEQQQKPEPQPDPQPEDVQMQEPVAPQAEDQNHSNQDEEDNDEEEDQIDEYDEDQQLMDEQSSSYYDDDDDEEPPFDHHFANQPRRQEPQQNDIIRRPQPQQQRGEFALRAGSRIWGDPVEIRGFGDRIFSSAGMIHRGEPQRASEVFFGEQWTQQEQLAQNVLHSLCQVDQPDDRINDDFFMPNSENLGNRNRDAKPPKSLEEMNDRYRMPSLNKMSEKFDCLLPMDKARLLQLLKENIKEFTTSFAYKKAETIQFRTSSQLERDGALSTTSIMRQHFREVIEAGNDSIEGRIRIMEAHMEMLIQGERDDGRMVIHHLMGDERDARDEPIDLIGNEIDINLHQFNQPNLSDQLLDLLVIPPNDDNQFSQSLEEQQRGDPQRNNNPFAIPSTNPFMIPRSVSNELPGLFNSLEIINPFLQGQFPFADRQSEAQQRPNDQEEQKDEIAPVDALQISSSSSSQEVQPADEPQPAQQQEAQQPQQPQPQQFAYGYPIEVLQANEIDHEILSQLDEDVRNELLSSINWQAQPPQQPGQPSVIEPEQQAVQQQQQNAAEAEANQIGIDQDFLANLPLDIRQEIIQNERLRNQNLGRPEQRQPAQANAQDAATLLAVVTDPALRVEVLLNLSPSTIQTLPENLRQEAERAQQNARQERNQARQNIQRLHMERQREEQHQFRGLMFDRPLAWRYDNPFVGRVQQDAEDIHFSQIRPHAGSDKVATIDDIEKLQITADQCYFRLFIDDAYFKIKAERNLITLIENNLGKPFLEIILNLSLTKMFSQIQSLDKDIKLNLIPTINQLIFSKPQSIKFVLEWLLKHFGQGLSEMNEQGQVQAIVMIGALRLLISINKDIAQQILIDYLSIPQSEMQALMTHMQQLSSHEDKTVSRNLQQALNDILQNSQLELLLKKQPIQEQSIIRLIEMLQLLNLTLNGQSLVHNIGKLLLRIGKQKAHLHVMIIAMCRLKQQETQKGLVAGLQRVLSILEGQDIEIDEGGESLHYSMSQHSQQQVQPLMQINTRMSTEEVSGVEVALRDTQRDLVCSRQISQVLTYFKATADKQESFKGQIYILNQILRFFKDHKNLKPFLAVLKQHIGCIFEFNQVELNKLGELSERDKKESSLIKMQPVVGQTQSSKQKICVAVFKNGQPEISDQLFEFCKFCMLNKQIINKLYMAQTNDISAQFNMGTFVKAMPNILNFENKRAFFRKEIEKMKREGVHRDSTSIKIRRKDIFTEAYAQLGNKQASDLKGRLYIDFVGEAGVDAGGLARDFFIELSRAMFNPNYSLFKLTSNGVTYYPNDQSYVNPEHLNYYRFVGRIIGKALFDGHLLECYFSKPLYKMMVGEDLCFEDQKDLDDDAYRGYKWSLENDIEEHGLYFCIDQDNFGKIEHKELIEGGVDIKVTNENKLDYFQKLAYYKMYTMIKEQVDAFLKGFYELIPRNLVKIFSHSELELLISGLPDFNLSDLRANTDYVGYTQTCQQVRWLWQILAEMSKEEIGRFLQFVTGSSKIPLEGFRALQGQRGPQRFQIKRVEDTNRLPVGHTCFNSLDLPTYTTKETMKEKLMFAVMETSDFGIA